MNSTTTAVEDVEALTRLLAEADEAAHPDDGDSDTEIDRLREALAVALTRWPEIAPKDSVVERLDLPVVFREDFSSELIGVVFMIDKLSFPDFAGRPVAGLHRGRRGTRTAYLTDLRTLDGKTVTPAS
jgi:hypothetical protein